MAFMTYSGVRAVLISHTKRGFNDGSIREVKIWRLPTPLRPSEHGYKYSLVFVVDGQRLVGFDNERGKGDHYHLNGVECPYTFVDLATLLRDFFAMLPANRRMP